MLACGADLERMVEGDPEAPEAVAARLPLPRSSGAAGVPLVLLARTSPLTIAVLRVRRVLEELAPWLARAPWLVFHDPDAEPRFMETATALGSFDSSLEFAPFWYAPDDRTYLVVSKQVANVRLLGARLDALIEAGRPTSDGEPLPASQVRITPTPVATGHRHTERS